MVDLLKNIKLLSQHTITEKRVLLRVDFNVSLTEDLQIADDVRIVKSIPTIKLLLKNNNKIILVSHLGRPKGRDGKSSLKPIAAYLTKAFPENNIILVNDFLSKDGKKQLSEQRENDIILLENIRFYEGEETNDEEFSKQLSTLADAYVNDAFGVSHRNAASVVGITKLLPSYCGLLLEEEVRAVEKIMENPKRPVVAIIGGAKISTKIIILSKLLDAVGTLILGGGLANTFLLAEGYEVGKSLVEKDQIDEAKRIISLALEKNVTLVLPADSAGLENNSIEKTYKTDSIPPDFSILDIGPETQSTASDIISKANTILWNGPVGFAEDKRFAKGTQAVFQSIVQNTHAFSLVGGGDTLACVSGNKDIDKITHVSTGGGAMLELIENGTLPGIEALRTF